jgi:hypothetical protein
MKSIAFMNKITDITHRHIADEISADNDISL